MKFPAKYTLVYLLVQISLLFLASTARAFPSASDNFKLEGEFGIFGGAKTSDSYRLTDTGGGFAVGFSDSNNYRNCSGFQCVIADVAKITVTLSSNSITLGTLTTSGVNTDSHTLAVTTNRGGYTTRVIENGNLCRSPQPCDSANDIADVGDGAVTANSEEYGIATSETGNDVTQDTDCTSSVYSASPLTSSPQSVANHGGPTFNAETTTICYAGAIAGSTAAGTYNQVVTFITTGAF